MQRLTLVFLGLILAIILTMTVSAIDPTLYDYNNDDKITLVDSRTLEKVINEEISCPSGKVCDTNGDGILDKGDIVGFVKVFKETYSGPSTSTTKPKIPDGTINTLNERDFGKRTLIKLYDSIRFETRNLTIQYIKLDLLCKKSPCQPPVILLTNGEEHGIKEGRDFLVNDVRIKLEKITNDNNTIFIFYDQRKTERIEPTLRNTSITNVPLLDDQESNNTELSNNTKPLTECAGCFSDSVCYAIGERLEEPHTYCTAEKNLSTMKANGITCVEDYECEKGVCITKKCGYPEKEVKPNMIVRFFLWMLSFF